MINFVSDQYWNCDCEKDYIKPKIQEKCKICNTDSAIKEVIEHNEPLKQNAKNNAADSSFHTDRNIACLLPRKGEGRNQRTIL